MSASQEIINHYDTQRILHDAELIKGGAAMEAGRLVLDQSQIAALAKESPVTEYAASTPETEKSREAQVAEYMKHAAYLLDAHSPRHTFGFASAWDSKMARLLGVENRDSLKSATDFRQTFAPKLSIERQNELAQTHNLDEVVRFRPVIVNGGSPTYRNFDPTSPYAKEKTVAVSYDEIGQRRPGYATNRDALGRPGVSVNAVLFMPESKAKELYDAVHQDPTLIREMVEYGALHNLELDKDKWNTQLRPRYDEWREQNGGVARMAIGPMDGQAEIVDF